MNFELPTRRNLVQKAIDAKKLSAKASASISVDDDEVAQWQIKYDGCHMIAVVLRAHTLLFSRQGEVVRSCAHIARKLDATPTAVGRVYFGEVWHPDFEFESISGFFRTHEEQPQLSYLVFDSVTVGEFVEGYSSIPYHQRTLDTWEALGQSWLIQKPVSSTPSNSGELSTYVNTMQNFHKRTFATDGFVVHQLNAPWVAGGGTQGHVLKMKSKISVDLRVEAIIEGTGEWAGHVGSLVCSYKGKKVQVQAGKLDMELRKHFFENPDKIIGKIIEVTALGETNGGKLREPHLERLRFDKLPHETD